MLKKYAILSKSPCLSVYDGYLTRKPPFYTSLDNKNSNVSPVIGCYQSVYGVLGHSCLSLHKPPLTLI